MAIEFATIKIHSRSKGQSSVAAAAYRSATRLIDEHTGEVHDYESKKNVIYSEVLLPQGADEKFKSREYLWNKVEEAEKRINSVVCKDIIIALPKELLKEDLIEISRRYTEEQFTSKGVGADIAIHNNEGNPHCHILVTTRRILGDKFDSHKARDLDAVHSHSKQSGNWLADKNDYNTTWKTFQNKYFEEKNIDIVVDQPYLVAQTHEGRVTNDTHYLKEINKERVEQSKQIALNAPELMLTILTKRLTVFSEKDIESIAYKHSENENEYNQIKGSIINNSNVYELGIGNDGRMQYSTKYAIQKENILINNSSKLSKINNHTVSTKSINRIIEKTTLSKDQQNALKHITQGGDITVVAGKPGTGKSYMLNSAREVWEENGYRVNGTAVSGIASEGLEKSSMIDSRVIASLNYRIEQGYTKLSEKDILVVDEAGMVDTYDLEKLVRHVKVRGAKIVLIGDPDQLQPVGPGASFKAVMEEIGFEEMTEIRRQEVDWQKQATANLSKGNTEGIDAYNRNNLIFISDKKDESVSKLIDDWSKNITDKNLSESIIIAHRNKDVISLNENARAKLIDKKLLDDSTEKVIDTDKGKLKIAVGEKILFTKRNRKLGVNNGTFATVSNFGDSNIQFEIKDGDSLKNIDVNTDEYNHISHGYASTVHKLQGTTFDYSYIYAGGKSWSRNITTVALSRHRKNAKIYADKKTFKDYDHLKKTMMRDGYKDSVLNYPVSYSLRHGIDPDSVKGRAVNKLAGAGEKIVDKWNWLLNYQKYLEKQALSKSNEEILKQRKEAVKVASYIDERFKLFDYRNKLNSELKENEKLYNHKEYHGYYLKQTELNKTSHYLYSNYEKFEKALNLNNLDITDLKNGTDTYLKQQTVRDFILSYNTNDREGIEYYSNEINKDLRSHYSHFVHLNTTDDLKTEDISIYIRKQAVLYNYTQAVKEKALQYINSAASIKRFYDLESTRKEFWRDAFKNRKVVLDKDTQITVVEKFDSRPVKAVPLPIKLTDEQRSHINMINSELREAAFKIENLSNNEEYDKIFEIFNLDKNAVKNRSSEYIYSKFNKSRIDVASSWTKYRETHCESDRENALVFTEKRNSEAYNISNNYDRFADIIGKSKLTKEDISKYAKTAAESIVIRDRINKYIESSGELGAYRITSKDENYLIKLKLICEERKLDYSDLKKSIDIDSYNYFTKYMDADQIKNFHIARDFSSSYKKYRELVSKNQFKGFDKLSDEERKEMFKLSSRLEDKAHSIHVNLANHAEGLEYCHIEEDLISKYEEKYQKSQLRNEVRSLKDAKASSGRLWHEAMDKSNEEFTRNLAKLTAGYSTESRDNIASEIIKDIDKYRPYLEKFKITESDIKKYAARKIVTEFNDINVSTAKAWKEYFENKENKTKLTNAIELADKRNSQAYNLLLEAELYKNFFIKKDDAYLGKFDSYIQKHIQDNKIDNADNSLNKNMSTLFDRNYEKVISEKLLEDYIQTVRKVTVSFGTNNEFKEANNKKKLMEQKISKCNFEVKKSIVEKLEADSYHTKYEDGGKHHDIVVNLTKTNLIKLIKNNDYNHPYPLKHENGKEYTDSEIYDKAEKLLQKYVTAYEKTSEYFIESFKSRDNKILYNNLKRERDSIETEIKENHKDIKLKIKEITKSKKIYDMLQKKNDQDIIKSIKNKFRCLGNSENSKKISKGKSWHM